MKNLWILALVLFLSACSENLPEVCEDTQCFSIGEWEWTSSYGSIAGATWTPESTGMTKRLEIDEMELSFYEDDILVNQFSYKIFETDTIFQGVLTTFISYDENIREFKATDTKIEIRDLCCDGYDDYYDEL